MMQPLADLPLAFTAWAPPMSQECYLLCFFCLGFALFRTEALQRQLRWKGVKDGVTTVDQKTCITLRSLEFLQEEFRLGRHEAVLDAWPNLECYTSAALALVVKALIALGRAEEVGIFLTKVVGRMPQLKATLHETLATVAAAATDGIRQELVTLALTDILHEMSGELDVTSLELLLSVFARLNDEARVGVVMKRLSALGLAAKPEALCFVVDGFLLRKNLDAALGYLQQLMLSVGQAPCQLLVSAVRVASEFASSEEIESGLAQPRVWDVFRLLDGAKMPDEAAVAFLKWSLQQAPVDISMADSIEENLNRSGSLPASALEVMVRIHASPNGSHPKARSCFDELVKRSHNGGVVTEGALVGMILACGSAKFTSLAEHILAWARSNNLCSMPVFSAAVKVLAAAKQPDRVCDLYEAVAEEGLTPDEILSSQLIKLAAQAGRTDLARKLFEDARSPNAQNYLSMIRACGQEGDAAQAIQILDDLCIRGEADTQAYNCALDVCVSCGDATLAGNLFEDMKRSGSVDVVSHNILLKLHVGEGGSWKKAVALLDEMRGGGFEPNTATYNSLLTGLLANGDFPKAWRTIDLMESSGAVIDAHTISILFRGFRKGKIASPEGVDRVLALIRKHNVRIDDVLVNAALEACIGLRDHRRLQGVLEAFQRAGWSIPKNATMQTYGMLVKAHGQCGNLDMVWRIWREVKLDRSLVPSDTLYGQMLDVLVSNECLDDALELFAEMKRVHRETLDSQGVVVAYAMIIRGFAQRKECARALALYEEMKAAGAQGSLVMFNTLIDACGRVGDMDSAARLFREMVEAECVPDLITYSTLIKGYCIRGELDQAMQLFALMRRKGIRPDAIVFNSLLDGCARKEMPSLCEQVVSDMEEAGVAPSNHSASILIKLYGRIHDVDAAFRVLDELPLRYSFRPNTAVFTCLMATCAANGRLDLAMGILPRMKAEGCWPDEKTYSTLLRSTLRAGSVEQCELVVNAALDDGGRRCLDAELAQSVLLLAHRRNLWAVHGQPLLERIRAAGIWAQSPFEAPGAGSCKGPRGHADERQARRTQQSRPM